MNLKNAVAVLTGAGSGIGRATAISLAKRGCHLALADINAEGLATTAKLVEPYEIRVSQHVLDVSDRVSVAAFPDQVITAHGKISLLINNAGVAMGGTFQQVSEHEFDWVMRVNFESVVCMTRAFLPSLHNEPEAQIVNISSLFGLISPPGQAAYSASKFAVRGFSNALRHELANTKVGVTVVHPGGVATSISSNAKVSAGLTEEQAEKGRRAMQKLLRLQPEQASEIIVRGIEKRRARVLVGRDALIASWLERLMPVNYWRVMTMKLKR
ncbi:SDR family NAD(P)-dependent oxidoreductase [Pseudomonas frederiksbergensis]|uniref:SDR family NAD(P)-dependent oxidoreductase n=1 Tax=Pseudomonas frederiksbergensis TaxID=104087 RepID=UPI003D1DC05B